MSLDWPTREEITLKTRIHRIRLLGEVQEEKSMLSVKIDGKRIDFWPHTDTFYLHSKFKYGTGIFKLLDDIEKYRAKE